MEKIKKCGADLGRGGKCLRRAAKDSDRCVLHQSSEFKGTPEIDDTPKNSEVVEIQKPSGQVGQESANECAICLANIDLEAKDVLKLESCSHSFHAECLSGLTKMECPLCRKIISGLPKELENKILSNQTDYARERVEAEREEIMRMIIDELGHVPTRVPPQIEVFAAIRYVMLLGIPSYRIPRNVRLELDPDSPLPVEGSIFDNTVRHLIEEIQKNIKTQPEEDESQESSSEDEYESTDDESGDEDFDSDEDFESPGPLYHRVSMSVANPSPSYRYIPRELFTAMRLMLSELDEDE